MNILANDGIAESGIKLLQEAGHNVSTEKIPQEKLEEGINEGNFEILLVRSATKVRKETIDACPGLKLIGRGGVGMDNIDVEYAKEKGIHVINTPAASSESVAELVFSHLFGLVRFLHDANRMMPEEGMNEFASLKKKYSKGLELRGKTLGIIGFGRIGQAVAKNGLGLGMNILASDEMKMNVEIGLDIQGHGNIKVPISTTDRNSVLSRSDFISIHTPAQSDGSPVLGKNEFEQMKDGVILINASRGGVVDEEALCDALDSEKVRAAGLDVFIGEPVPSGRVLKHSNISLTPHIGAATREAQSRVGIELAQQIIETFQAV